MRTRPDVKMRVYMCAVCMHACVRVSVSFWTIGHLGVSLSPSNLRRRAAPAIRSPLIWFDWQEREAALRFLLGRCQYRVLKALNPLFQAT